MHCQSIGLTSLLVCQAKQTRCTDIEQHNQRADRGQLRKGFIVSKHAVPLAVLRAQPREQCCRLSLSYAKRSAGMYCTAASQSARPQTPLHGAQESPPNHSQRRTSMRLCRFKNIQLTEGGQIVQKPHSRCMMTIDCTERADLAPGLAPRADSASILASV